jgi:transposase
MPDPQRSSSQRRYPRELRERAVRMVFTAMEESGDRHGHIARVARQLGIRDESLRLWVRRTEASREREAVGMTDAEHIVQLEREVRELRRANEILKAAAAFFARELDPHPPL